ncbi:beta-N-acetylhexosaminidase [Candidatus Sumerlaeota bacterium]|nr:beta-N-acetylhexosaminidase [Candidatus Sumerlaeota bacterium]
MKIVSAFLFLTFPLFFFSNPAFADKQLKLIPAPREINFEKGEITLTEDWKIYVPGNKAEDFFAAELLSGEADACIGYKWEIVRKKPEKRCILLEKHPFDSSEPELFLEQGYVLETSDDVITIRGAADAGRFYGIQTMRQILRNAVNKSIPKLRIKDYPSLEWRGISDDISRGQVSHLEDFREIVRDLAFYKKNLYQPYIEDMFLFDTDPKIGSDRGAVTKSEMEALVREAAQFHVVVSPVFECLGHQDRLLSLPENRKYAEIDDPDGRPWSFAPVNEETFDFVTKLVDEIAVLTPSPFFHIGGDESFDVGRGQSRKMVEKYGVGRVHADYFSRLNSYINVKHNRKMMVYADMILRHPEAMAFMPKDCVMIDWRYNPDDDFKTVAQLKEAGFEHIMTSPGIWSWASYYPNFSRAFRNIAHAAEAAKKENLSGCVTSSWGDNGAENLRQNNWPGFAYSSAALWEKDTPDPDRFLRRFVALHFGDDSEELAEALRLLGWYDYLETSYLGNIFHKTVKLKTQDKEWLDKLEELSRNMEKVKELTKGRRGKLRFKKDYLDIVDHVVRRNLYIVRRDNALNRISEILEQEESGDIPSENQKQVIDELIGLRNDLAELAGEYPELWLGRNKFPKLDDNMTRLHGEIAFLQDYIVRALRGELTGERPPWGQWFWYPDENPAVETEEGTRYFVRAVNLEELPAIATIQGWADDKATVYINGHRTLSVGYNDRPRNREILSRLKKGRNILAIEAYNSIGAAGILLEINLEFSDGSKLQITGDEGWLTTDKEIKNWNIRPPKGRSWKKIKILGTGLMQPWDFIDW